MCYKCILIVMVQFFYDLNFNVLTDFHIHNIHDSCKGAHKTTRELRDTVAKKKI